MGRLCKLVLVVVLSATVIASFILSSLGWRHFETSESTRIIVASLILLAMYSLMIFELVDRNLAALIGMAASVAAHDCLIEFVGMEQILRWLDLETLSLLFGLMIIVSVLGCSGLFNFIAIWSYEKANGRFWLLISILSFLTGFLSAFVDNVSTMLLVSPTLIKLAELEHMDPRYLLTIMVIFCNLGGCATPVGDPPNLIIIGDQLISQLGITFSSFTAYCAPGVLLTMGCTLLYLRIVYKSKESFRPPNYKKSATQDDGDSFQVGPIEYENRVSICRPEENSPISQTTPAKSVELKQVVDLQFEQTNFSLCQAEHPQREQRRGSRLTKAESALLRQAYSIKSQPVLILSLGVLLATILLFFVQSLPGTRLTLGWVSLFSGLLLIVATSTINLTSLNKQRKTENDDDEGEEEEEDKSENFEFIIRSIEWSTLLFFFALFVVMEVMAKLGLIKFVGQQVVGNLIESIPAGRMREAGAITIILWTSGIASACIDNVPFTSMMIKILGTIVAQSRSSFEPEVGVLKPLVFALAFGACFGGNGTIIGASANLVTAGVSSRYGYPLTFNWFFKFTAPITIISLIVANIYLVFVFVVLGL